MLFDIRKDGLIYSSVREICEFLRRSGDAYTGSATLPTEKMKKGAAFHRSFQSEQSKTLPTYSAEVHLSTERAIGDGFLLVLSGIADGICDAGENVIIDEIKTVSQNPESLSFGSIPAYDLQLYFYAYMYMRENGIESVTLRLIYHNCDSDVTNIIEKEMTYTEATELFDDACRELLMWVKLYWEHIQKRNETVSVLPFPFDIYRKGQRELCAAIFRSIRDSHNLFAEAPTGIGKTISALYPAYKALGEDFGEKIFYLTAKEVQRKIASDAIELMRKKGLYTRYCVLTAKSKSCLSGGNCMPQMCKYSKGCFDRMNDALWDIVNAEASITPEIIADYAEKHCVCPHELALDCTYFCDCVIGDYNHLYDPQAALQRYFSVGGDYIALVDEAHNLPDRAREMYTASLSASVLSKAHKELSGAPVKVRREFSRLARIIRELGAPMREAEEEQRLLGSSAGSKFEDTLGMLCDKYKAFLGEDICSEQKEKTLEVFFDCSFMQKIAALAYEHPSCFKVYTEAHGKDTAVIYACTDPSPLISAISSSIRSTAFFSATLCPFEYYTELLAMDDADKYIRLSSPFPSKNRLVALYPSISTRLRDREGSYGEAAKIIYSAISEKVGNYLAFFPSFKYLSSVLEMFNDMYPDVKVVVQEPSMDNDGRKEFLEAFDSHGEVTLVGFAVCGGLFSEGIDLTGDRLSGTIIFGTGMPSICFERDLIKQSFESESNPRRGFSYAYTYPGLNRVFQAAGRVIRKDSDRGFIVLCEERYIYNEYRKHFPTVWDENLIKVYDCDALGKAIRGFWKGFDD